MTHKMTKLKVLDNPENGLTNDQISELNMKRAEAMVDMGFISGGTWAIEEGHSYTGTLRADPEIGKPVYLDGSEWFRSSVVKDISKQPDGSYIIKTVNSVYKLEELK